MTRNEKLLLIALKALIESTKPDASGQIELTAIETAVIEANALIWEMEN